MASVSSSGYALVTEFGTLLVAPHTAPGTNVRAPIMRMGASIGIEAPLVMVATGPRHAAAVTIGGDIYFWGYNGYGEQGSAPVAHVGVPACMPRSVFGGARALQVALGLAHTLVLVEGGRVFCCGAGDYGRLGLASTADTHALTPVDAEAFCAVPAVFVAAGFYSSAAVRADGCVWTWGLNRYGQLGLGDLEDRLAPAPLARFGVCLRRVSAPRVWVCAACLCLRRVSVWAARAAAA